MRKRSFFYDLNFGVATKKRQIHTSMPVAPAAKATLTVLEKMNARIIQAENGSGVISAYKNWNFLSDGEVLTISIHPSESEQGCDIVIQSESAFPKLWDLGVNNRNLNKFEKLFSEIKHSSDKKSDAR